MAKRLLICLVFSCLFSLHLLYFLVSRDFSLSKYLSTVSTDFDLRWRFPQLIYLTLCLNFLQNFQPCMFWPPSKRFSKNWFSDDFWGNTSQLICLLIRKTWRYEGGCNYLLYLLVKNTKNAIYGWSTAVTFIFQFSAERTYAKHPPTPVCFCFLSQYLPPLEKKDNFWMVLSVILTRHKLLLKIYAKFWQPSLKVFIPEKILKSIKPWKRL